MPGMSGHDGGFVAGEAIQQTRFAGIRPAGDDDRHALAQYRALLSLRGDLFAQINRLKRCVRRKTVVGEEVDFLFGKSIAASTCMRVSVTASVSE